MESNDLRALSELYLKTVYEQKSESPEKEEEKMKKDDDLAGSPNKKKNGKKADKDYDGDGKVESSKDEYFGSKDKAIKKAMEEEIEGGVSVETYTKDTKFMEIETLDVITAEPLRSDWRSDLKEGAIETITNWLKLTKDPKNHEVSDKTMTGKAITGLQKRDKANQEAMKLLNQSYSWRKDLGILDEGGK